MPRIRTIKPEFFTSEDVCRLSPLARLLFIAAWCEADREGRLVWKPGTLKLRYLPADACDIDALAGELIAADLVVPYGNGLAWVPRFLAHQVVNNRESESRLPAPDAELVEAWGSRRDASGTREHASSSRRDASSTREHATSTRVPFLSFPVLELKADIAEQEGASLFAQFWNAYPKKDAKVAALKAWRKLAPSSALVEVMLGAIARQSATDAWVRGFVPNPATWLNGRRWEDQAGTPAGSTAAGAAPGGARTGQIGLQAEKTRAAVARRSELLAPAAPEGLP